MAINQKKLKKIRTKIDAKLLEAIKGPFTELADSDFEDLRKQLANKLKQ